MRLLPVLLLACVAQPAAADSHQAALERLETELRSALERNDPEALALLVQWPLQVNLGAGRSESLVGPASLQERYASLFGGAWREQVLASTPGDAIRRERIGLANGALWLDQIDAGDAAPRLKIAIVNAAGPDHVPPGRQLRFACETVKHRVLVDVDPAAEDVGNSARYRVWNLPKFPPAAPDLSLSGSWGYEGTGACAHEVGSFASGSTTIMLSVGGCGEAPPEGARAQLSVSRDHRLQAEWWCY